MPLSWTSIIKIIKLPNFVVHDNDNWTCNNSNNKIGRKKTRVKIKDSNAVVLKKFKNQISLSKTTTIESKEKTLSRTTAFVKHINLSISLTEKLNS